jgi:hypothetical protein
MTHSEELINRSETLFSAGESEPSFAAGDQRYREVLSLWDPLLTKQLRALLHTDSLLRLQHRDEHRPPEYQQYSSLSLALKVFDVIIAHTGLGQDIDYDQVVNELLPLLEAMDRSANVPPDHDRHVRMAERVLAALFNEEDGRQPFMLPYTAFEQGNAVRRILATRLLEERYQADGRVVLRLSNESANLLLNAFTVDLEDAQAAAEAIIQSQLARGRIEDARVSAQWALQQSVRLRDHIERRLSDTRRDFQSVDWKDEMHRMVEEALIHVRDRCIVENNIVTTAREQREQLAPGSEKSYQLAQIISLIEACRQQHLALQRRLMEAPRVFFEEQERQIFTFRTPPTFPHPQNDLLAPLLLSPRVRVIQALDSLVSSCLPISPPGIFSLARYLHYLLQPKREMSANSVPIEEPELIDADYDQTYFTPDILQRGEKLLSELEKPERLSHVIQRAQLAGESLAVIKALIFLVLEFFDPKDSTNPEMLPVDVVKIDDRQFWLMNVAGDDVLLLPRGKCDASRDPNSY